jgi:putative ATPase
MELLANKMRPTKLSEVYGQDHLIGPGKVLSNLVKNKVMFSIILYGPPGTGKTSIANAIVNELHKEYRF